MIFLKPTKIFQSFKNRNADLNIDSFNMARVVTQLDACIVPVFFKAIKAIGLLKIYIGNTINATTAQNISVKPI